MLFRKWAAYSAISGALERRVWVKTAGSILYPNLYVIMVSPPGVGKTRILNEVHDMWAEPGLFNVSPTSVTKAALVDQMAERSRTVTLSKDAIEHYHTLLVVSQEFGVLLPKYDLEFLNTLNDLYDCRRIYEERRRHLKEVIKIPNPQLMLLAGTQPAYLGQILPDIAFNMGFTARTIMVYVGQKPKVKLFAEVDEATVQTNGKLRAMLVRDVEAMAGMYGEMAFTQDAKDLLEHWVDADCPPIPSHPKLLDYLPRRILHVLKLCMIFAAEHGSMEIDVNDTKRAMSALFEVEDIMPEIFKDMTISTDAAQLEEAFQFIWSNCYSAKTDSLTPLMEHQLRHYLSRKFPVNKISFAIDAMLRSNMIMEYKDPKKLVLPGAPTQYVPLPKQAHGRDLKMN